MPSSIEARQQLRDSINSDIAARTAAHQANIARIMAAPPAVQPLALLAHGDSWFNYPLTGNGLPLTDTDIIAQLPALGTPNPVIYNISHFGDAASVEMGLPKQQRLIASLTTPANWFVGGKPDAILFSGGGNDIVGDTFCIFLNYAVSGASGLNVTRFDEALGMVEACYLSLFALRDQYAPGVPIFGHCYDFPIPNGVAPPCAGPWLQPSLNFYNWTNIVEGTAIVHQALIEFKNVLQNLTLDPANNFILIDTQGTLVPASWANELHPYPPGFNQFATLFATALKNYFPGRI